MMAGCDLCGKACRLKDLETLLDSYQVPGVEDVCPDCRRWANKVKQDLLTEISERMRQVIFERKGLPPQEPAILRWWRRLVA